MRENLRSDLKKPREKAQINMAKRKNTPTYLNTIKNGLFSCASMLELAKTVYVRFLDLR